MPSTYRQIQDGQLAVSVIMPNAAEYRNTPGLDLGTVTPFPVTDVINFRISNTIATGAASKNINVQLQDSADNSTFANVYGINLCQIVQNTTKVVPNAALQVGYLPPGVRRYLRLMTLGEASGGNANDGTVKLEILT